MQRLVRPPLHGSAADQLDAYVPLLAMLRLLDDVLRRMDGKVTNAHRSDAEGAEGRDVETVARDRLGRCFPEELRHDTDLG